MTRTDPLVLEMILQRERFFVGGVGRRGDMAERLAREGMTTDQLNLLIAYHEDRKDMLGDWRGALIGTLGKDGLWQAICADLEASPGRGGKCERIVRQDLDLSGSGHDCMHGTPRGHHCDMCDPQLPLGDKLERRRRAMLDSLVSWIMADVRAGRVVEDDDDEKLAKKAQTRAKVERLLRQHLVKPGSLEREDRDFLRGAVPDHLLNRRIHPAQRFPGEPVEERIGGRYRKVSEAKFVTEANEHSRELIRTGPLVGHVELAEQRKQLERAAAAPKADDADKWRDLTDGVF